MEYVRVSGTFELAGSVPNELKENIVKAVESVHQTVFFEKDRPLKREVSQLENEIARNIAKWGIPERNYCPFQDNRFEVDLAVVDKKLLIEIEKGNYPRLELEIIKIASACHQFPKKWRFGALIVPSSYIELRLAGRKPPFDYLERLKPLVQPIIARMVEGFLVVGYKDPRSEHAPT